MAYGRLSRQVGSGRCRRRGLQLLQARRQTRPAQRTRLWPQARRRLTGHRATLMFEGAGNWLCGKSPEAVGRMLKKIWALDDPILAASAHVLADRPPSALFARAALAHVLADRPPSALFAVAASAHVLADRPPSALFALAAYAHVLADRAPSALFARAAFAHVLADRPPSALFARAALSHVLADRPPSALFALAAFAHVPAQVLPPLRPDPSALVPVLGLPLQIRRDLGPTIARRIAHVTSS